jgi:hypothetical protein
MVIALLSTAQNTANLAVGWPVAHSVADISLPSLIYQRLGITIPELFRRSGLLRIDP